MQDLGFGIMKNQMRNMWHGVETEVLQGLWDARPAVGLCYLNRVAWYSFLNLYEYDKAEKGQIWGKKGMIWNNVASYPGFPLRV